MRREERLWGVPTMLCFLARGDVPLHAAAVNVGGEAVLLAAPGYYGKTTLAAGFDAAGYRVLAEDVACIRFAPEPHVVPGPALLRVRGDVAESFDLPGARAVAESDNRVHFSLDPARRGDCTPVPLHAIVLLRKGEDGIALERVAAADTLRDLWLLSFRLPTLEDRDRCSRWDRPARRDRAHLQPRPPVTAGRASSRDRANPSPMPSLAEKARLP